MIYFLYRHFDTYNLYLNYCLAYASIIFIQSENMSRGIKLQFISIMKICIKSDTRYQLFIIIEIQSKMKYEIFNSFLENLDKTYISNLFAENISESKSKFLFDI